MPETAETALKVGNTVGESLVWDDRTQTLYWVDINERRIHALEPDSDRHRSWPTPTIATSISLASDGGCIVGLEKSIARWDGDAGFEVLAEIEPELPDNRLNEGVVGPDGALWVGTMFNNINPDGSAKEIAGATGRLYRVTADGAVTAVSDDRFGITNTFAWTDDGRLITADTLANTLYGYRCDPATGALSDRAVLLADYDRGLPDGSCMDDEGYVWNCRVVGGNCLIRMDDQGKIDRVIELPCSWPTSCCFAGSDLDTLYVTSARFTMTPAHLGAAPWEGDLFRVKPGVRGRPAHRFGQAATSGG